MNLKPKYTIRDAVACALTIIERARVSAGGHDFGYWGGNLEMYLRWYAEDW